MTSQVNLSYKKSTNDLPTLSKVTQLTMKPNGSIIDEVDRSTLPNQRPDETLDPNSKSSLFRLDRDSRINVLFMLYFFLSSCLGVAVTTATTIHTSSPPNKSLYTQCFSIYMNVMSAVSMAVLIVLVKWGLPRGYASFTSYRISFYLRLGIIVTGLATVIFYVLVLVEPLEAKLRGIIFTVNYPILVTYILTLATLIMNAYFIYKYHHVAICNLVPLSKFCFAHQAAHCIYEIAYYTVYDVYQLSMRLLKTKDNKIIASCYNAISVNVSLQPKTLKVLPFAASQLSRDYLSSFVIEYSILTASVMMLFFLRCHPQQTKETSQKNSSQDINTVSNAQSNQRNSDTVHPKLLLSDQEDNLRIHKKSPKCHKSHHSLFFGLIMCAIVLCYMIAKFVFAANNPAPPKEMPLVYLIFNCIFASFGIFLVICVGKKVFELPAIEIRHHFIADMNLLHYVLKLSICGIIFYQVFILIAEFDFLHKASTKFEVTSQGLVIAKFLIFFIQDLVQVGLIIYLLNCPRGARNAWQAEHKPGRTWITLLIFYNLLLWIRGHLSGQEGAMTTQHIGYYGAIPMGLVVSVMAMFVQLFHLCSSLALANVWNKAYKI